MSSTIASMCAVARGRTSGRRHPERGRLGQERRRDSGRRAHRCRSPAAAAPRMILSSMSVMFMTQRHAVARASAGGGPAGRRTGTSGSCRCGPGRRPSGRTSRPRRRRPSGSSGRVSPVSVSCSRTRHVTGSSDATASAEIDRPAPSSPDRLPVDALTLTAAASTPRSRAIASRIASRWPASRGRAATMVRSTLPTAPAGRGRRGARPRRASRPLAIPSGVARVRREQPTEVAEPGRAEQRVADRVQRDVAVRVAVETRRAVDRRCRRGRAGSRARTDGCPARCPTRDARATGEGRLDPTEVGRQRHLEVARISGDDMDRDSTGLEQGGLVGPRLGAVGRESLVRRAQQAAPDALRRLGGAERLAVDGRPDDRPVDALEGLGDRQDRDRRAVAPPSRR